MNEIKVILKQETNKSNKGVKTMEKTMTMKEVVEKATGIFIVTPDKAEFYSFHKATNVKPIGEPTKFSDNGFECIDRGLLFTLGGYDFGLDLVTYSWKETMGGYEVKESCANDAKFGDKGEERYRVWHGEIHDGCLALVLGKPESKESEEMSNLVIFHIMKKLSPKQFAVVNGNQPASHFYPHSDQKPYGVRKEATEKGEPKMKKSIKINGEYAYCKAIVDGAEYFRTIKIWDGGGTYTFEGDEVIRIGDKVYFRKCFIEKWMEGDAVEYMTSHHAPLTRRIIEATADNVELNAKLEDIARRADNELVSALDEKLGVVYDDDEEEEENAVVEKVDSSRKTANVGVVQKVTSD